MDLHFVQNDHVAYCKGYGRLCCHVDAVHAAPPGADLFTGEIVKLLVAHTGCAGIIGTVSRFEADLNRGSDSANNKALQDYRASVKEILLYLGILGKAHDRVTAPYLHLAIHGMKDRNYGPYGIEIGTRYGESCSKKVRDFVLGEITSKARAITPWTEIAVDHRFVGDESITYHRLGDGQGYRGYGPNFNTFQIEIARTLRENHLPQIVELLSMVMFKFQAAFVGAR